jgi:pimeloyl-ACP methyl ester carboxylesterase
MGLTHRIKGGGGLALAVREAGQLAGQPILFIHGFSQSGLCWRRQFAGSLAEEFRLLAVDLRGHGESEKPQAMEHYADAQLWADDIAAIIDTLKLKHPVLVGWSYGGFVIGDYLRAYGQARAGAINFVGAAVKSGSEAAGKMLGAGAAYFRGMVAEELEVNIAASRGLLAACTARAMERVEFETMLAASMVVPPGVRRGLLRRRLDYDDVLAKISVPVLVTQGMQDRVVLPAMAEHIVGLVPGAEKSFYQSVGHAPFIEAAERFNRELGELARQAGGGVRPSGCKAEEG